MRYPYDMEMEFKPCYEAVRSRDARFDGRFFTAVLTTGIYCRPICPARIPKPENVRFYACAAAAEEAGFRPCKRCQPQHAPGTPLWIGAAATVSRALVMLSDGFLDDHSLEELAEHLHLTSRHLRRLFTEHLGTNPVAVAQTRRLHFARQLLASPQGVSAFLRELLRRWPRCPIFGSGPGRFFTGGSREGGDVSILQKQKRNLTTLLMCITIHIRRCIMRTNIVLDDKLVEEAFRCSKTIKTKRALLEAALKEYVATRKVKDLRDLRGKIEFDENYDYKQLRVGK